MANKAKKSRRADGLYKKSIVIGRDEKGNPTRKYFYGKTIREVDEKMAEYKLNMSRGTLSAMENVTFHETAELWLNNYKSTLSEKMQARYSGIISKHLAPLSTMWVKDLKPFHLQGILNQMATKGYARKTIVTVKQTAAKILATAVLNDILYRNVFEAVEIPKASTTERLPITEEQKKLIVSTWAGHRMGLPALLMLYCGLRRGEVLALTWNDIDLEKKLVSVTKAVVYTVNEAELKEPKSKAGRRIVPIPDAIIPALHASRENRSFLVCPSAEGEAMSAQSYKRAWESYMHYLNIQAGGRDASRSRPKLVCMEPFTAHQLRHTYATMLYDAGVDVLTAQKLLGHADLQVTMKVYTHLSEERRQKSIDALNAHINAEQPLIQVVS